MLRFKKAFYIILGSISLILGTVGAVVPVLPTAPFLMLATFSFAKSSKRLHTWFTNTKLYKENLESYVSGKGMTWETKIRIIVTVTILMAFGFTIMMLKALYIPCAILGAVWVFHLVYFIVIIKTIKENIKNHKIA